MAEPRRVRYLYKKIYSKNDNKVNNHKCPSSFPLLIVLLLEAFSKDGGIDSFGTLSAAIG